MIRLVIIVQLFSPATLFAGSYTQTYTRSIGAGSNSLAGGVYANCRFHVTRIGSSSSSSRQLRFRLKPKFAAGQQSQNSQSKTVMMLTVGNGMEGSISVNGESVRIRCRMTPAGYRLTISLGSVSKDGSKTTSLSTSVMVQRGQQIELGSIVNGLRSKNKAIGTGGVDLGKRKSKSSERCT